MQFNGTHLLSIFTLLVAPALALAAPKGPMPAWETSVDTQWQGASDLSQDGTGEVSSYTKPIRRTLTITSLGYEFRSWDFSSHEYLEATHAIGLDMRAAHQFRDSDWGLLALGGLTFAGEEVSLLSDGKTLGLGLAMTYQINEDLSVGFGARVQDTEERDARYFPIIFVDWQATEALRVRTANGVTAFYGLNRDGSTILDLGTRFTSKHYRAREQRLPSGQRLEPLVSEDAVKVEIGLTQKFWDNAKLRGYLGSSLWREFEIRGNDRELETLDSDASVYAGLSASVQF